MDKKMKIKIGVMIIALIAVVYLGMSMLGGGSRGPQESSGGRVQIKQVLVPPKVTLKQIPSTTYKGEAPVPKGQFNNQITAKPTKTPPSTQSPFTLISKEAQQRFAKNYYADQNRLKELELKGKIQKIKETLTKSKVKELQDAIRYKQVERVMQGLSLSTAPQNQQSPEVVARQQQAQQQEGVKTLKKRELVLRKEARNLYKVQIIVFNEGKWWATIRDARSDQAITVRPQQMLSNGWKVLEIDAKSVVFVKERVAARVYAPAVTVSSVTFPSAVPGDGASASGTPAVVGQTVPGTPPPSQ
jgi:hypothetical protein